MPQNDIVMIAVDDLTNVARIESDLGIDIHTPNLDRLRAMGVSFDNAYASVALCMPSRTAIMTGQSPFETGVHYNSEIWYEKVDPAITIPAILKAAGYSVDGYGKLFGTLNFPPDVLSKMFDDYAAQPLSDDDSNVLWGLLAGDPEATPDAVAVQNALSALASTPADKPLMLMVGFEDPHGPFTAPQNFLDLYPLDGIHVPVWDGDAPPQWMLPFLTSQGLAELRSSGDLEKLVQGYLANISEMDYRLGQLLDGIEASGRNPAIVLWSDHGYSLGDHDALHKFNLWEQAANSPLVVVSPDKTGAGTVNNGIVSFLDIAPTILGIAGIGQPERMSGQSLMPTVQDGAPTSGIALTSMFGSFSIRTDDFRYTRYQDGEVELFDHRNGADPEERHNRHGDIDFAGIESDMAGLLDQEMAAIGATWDPITHIACVDRGNGAIDYFLPEGASLDSIIDPGGFETFYSIDTSVTMPSWADNLVTSNRIGTTVILANALDNRILGNLPADHILGLDGTDTIDGFWGNDTIDGGSGDDSLAGSVGNDLILGGDGFDFINGGFDADHLSGDSGDDTIYGGDGSDTLDGGTGADRMVGGAGDDTYIVDSSGDIVGEALNAGIDTVLASVTTTLRNNVENLTLTGNAAINGTGNRLNNVIIGNGAANVLTGGDGNDTLDGGGSRDRLSGGAGNDTYIINGSSDIIVEDIGAGTDTVLASLTTTLGKNVENLTLTGVLAINGTGNALDNIIIGNDATNVIKGSDGNDILSGGGGADRLYGGIGADHFAYHSTSDSPAADYDIIFDFASQQGDRLDLSDLYTGALTFRGTGRFTGAGGEVRLTASSSGQLVQIDLDGDKTADLKILIKGAFGSGDIIF